MTAVVGEVTDSFVLVNRAKMNTRTIFGGWRGVTSTNHMDEPEELFFFGMNESIINQSGITQEDEGGFPDVFSRGLEISQLPSIFPHSLIIFSDHLPPRLQSFSQAEYKQVPCRGDEGTT